MSYKNKLKDLIKGIYGIRDISFNLKEKTFIIDRVDGNLIHNLQFNDNYREKLITLFQYTFCKKDRIEVDYGIDGRTKKALGINDMISNFCNFVGLKEIEVLNKNNSSCYSYTEDSPFEVIASLRKYSPHGEIVVCCNRKQMPQKVDNRIKTVKELLDHNKRLENVLGNAIFLSLKEEFLPLFFDEKSEVDNDKDKLDNSFKLARNRSRERLSDLLDFDPFKIDEITKEEQPEIIIIYDNDYNGGLKSYNESKKSDSEGIYEIPSDLYLLQCDENELYYKNVTYLPDIVKYNPKKGYKGNSKILLFTNSPHDDESVKEIIYKQYESEYTAYYKKYMCYIEKLIGIIFEFNFSALIHNNNDERKESSPSNNDIFNSHFSKVKSISDILYTISNGEIKLYDPGTLRKIKKEADDITEGAKYYLLNDLSVLIAAEKKKYEKQVRCYSELTCNPTISDAMIQWIASVITNINRLASYFSSYYDRFVPNKFKKEHYSNIRKYVESEKLTQAIEEVGIERNIFVYLKEALLYYIEEPKNPFGREN